MRNLALLIILGFISCGGTGGDSEDNLGSDFNGNPAPPFVNPGDTNCDGDVSFNTVIPDPGSSSSSDASSNPDSGGIGNPAVSRAVNNANFQGLKIIRMLRVDNATIIATCGSTINIGGDPVTTNNNPSPVS